MDVKKCEYLLEAACWGCVAVYLLFAGLNVAKLRGIAPAILGTSTQYTVLSCGMNIAEAVFCSLCAMYVRRMRKSL